MTPAASERRATPDTQPKLATLAHAIVRRRRAVIGAARVLFIDAPANLSSPVTDPA